MSNHFFWTCEPSPSCPDYLSHYQSIHRRQKLTALTLGLQFFRCNLGVRQERLSVQGISFVRPVWPLGHLAIFEWPPWFLIWVPSGNDSRSCGKSPCLVGKSHYKWVIFHSYVTLYQRVCPKHDGWLLTANRKSVNTAKYPKYSQQQTDINR